MSEGMLTENYEAMKKLYKLKNYKKLAQGREGSATLLSLVLEYFQKEFSWYDCAREYIPFVPAIEFKLTEPLSHSTNTISSCQAQNQA